MAALVVIATALVPLLGTPTIVATDDVVLVDGTVLTTNVEARTIIIPVGATMTYAEDVSLIATDS